MNSTEKSPTYSIGIIAAKFNEDVTSRLLSGAKNRAQQLGLKMQVHMVPGAVELPLAAKRMAATRKFDALVVLGAVIRGETDHYDYVCQIVSRGCLDVSLLENLPVIFGVLTAQTEQLALERAGGQHGNRGSDAVDAAIAMLGTLADIAQGEIANP